MRKYRKSGMFAGVDKFDYNYEKNFFNKQMFEHLFITDVLKIFERRHSVIYKLKVTFDNYMKYDQFSDSYKKLLFYLYLSSENELSSRLNGLVSFDVNKLNNNNNIKLYKDMSKFNIDGLEDFEKYKIRILQNGNLNSEKPVTENFLKKLEKYINMKGNRFIKKAHKLYVK